ncbi:MAG: hypothetical protein HPY69_14185 [Armatimonadetes bacterium]|nr:hypothetical protein [Armatimonadota bacterium]
MGRVIGLVVLMLMAGGVGAMEYAPRVVSEDRADAYSLTTFAQYPRWRDLSGDALAWELYQYLADPRSGLFHMNEVLEGDDDLNEYRTIRDPIKIINVYGYAYCAILGPVMAGIAEGVGLGEARTLVLPGWQHVASEAFYGGRWHYLDIDVRAVFRRPDGTLASMDEARADDTLWVNRGPLFFPKDDLAHTREVYRTTPVEYYHDFHSTGHTMDYVLRQGETFTRWWTPQGGRWHHDPVYNGQDWLMTLLESEPRGPKPNHRDFTVHNYGNGCFVYHPDLTEASTDFADGVYDATNVVSGREGLTLLQAGEGYAVFEVRSPYIIVPLVGNSATTADDSEASVVELEAEGVELSLSRDNGLTWETLSPSAPGRYDLTPYVAGTYGYLLRIVLRGQPQEAVVRSLRITTWVQVAPAALPTLHRGMNRLEYRTGDHYGLPTRVLEVRSRANRPENLLKFLVRPPDDYDPARQTARIRGEITARVEAPPGTRIAWFSAGASFTTHQGEAAAQTRNAITYATTDGGEFTEVFRANVPTYCNHWFTNADREVRLEEPTRTLFVRYFGDPAVNNIRIYAHCLDDRPRQEAPVRITHRWTENGQPRSHEVTLRGPGPYQIDVQNEPVDESIEISVPSDGAGG